jgi:hypothetical protein
MRAGRRATVTSPCFSAKGPLPSPGEERQWSHDHYCKQDGEGSSHSTERRMRGEEDERRMRGGGIGDIILDIDICSPLEDESDLI